jgi:hypothetical protein
MITAGNHEDYYNYNATLNRFNMPYIQSNSPSELYYSFNYSMIHFIGLCSDISHSVGGTQYNWLEQDLIAADADRAAHPWIIVYAHHPMYSSNTGHGSDTNFRNDMEPLFNQYNVDLAIWGHDHDYERSYPVYQGIPSDTSDGPYINPSDTIHIVAGMAGASLRNGWDPQPSWSAYREAEFGHVRITVTTDGNLHSEFVVNLDNTVHDEFWIVKNGSMPPIPPPTELVDLIPKGDVWKYDVTDPQIATIPPWNEPGFDDSSWSEGPAPLGFGDSTTYGTELPDNDGSYYFRNNFTLDPGTEILSATLGVAADNCAIVYLNGIVIDDDSGSNHEYSYWNRFVQLDPSDLQIGDNIVAVYVYNTGGSSDAYMDLELRIKTPVDPGSNGSNEPPILTLQPGWNLISLPYIQPVTDLDTIFSSISGSYDAVQWYDVLDTNDPWKQYNINKSSIMNDLDAVNHTMGFWIHITDSQEVLFEVPGNQSNQDQTISLNPGWNLVGYPQITSYNRTDGLNNTIFGIHIDQVKWYNASSDLWQIMDENDYFEPGRGYWVHSLTQHVWKLKMDNEPKIRISIPAYFSPGPLWDTACADAPATDIMIMNPLDGRSCCYPSTGSPGQSPWIRLYPIRRPGSGLCQIRDRQLHELVSC